MPLRDADAKEEEESLELGIREVKAENKKHPERRHLPTPLQGVSRPKMHSERLTLPCLRSGLLSIEPRRLYHTLVS